MGVLTPLFVGGVYAFLLTFARVGTALMIMPGVGDSFVPERVRLAFALVFALVVAPLVAPSLPQPVPTGVGIGVLVVLEMVVGAFIGTIARVLMTALDTAGMIISTQSGLGNAQLFNPAFATQGSLIGAFLSVTGVVLLLVTDMHHIMLRAVIDSYQVFPVGKPTEIGAISDLIAQALSAAFRVGIQFAAPFIIVGMLLYIGMGILSRLMPQVQVFMLTMPVQIGLALLALSLCASAGLLFWLDSYRDGLAYSFGAE